MLALGLVQAVMAGSIVGHRVALPALRLGGEWAGHTVEYSSESGDVLRPAIKALTAEQWNADKAMERRRVEIHVEGTPPRHAVGPRRVLPVAQSGSETLTLGAHMLEPEVLNARAWALDAAADESSAWQCETLFDGLCGDRPDQRADSLEVTVLLLPRPRTSGSPPGAPSWLISCCPVSNPLISSPPLPSPLLSTSPLLSYPLHHSSPLLSSPLLSSIKLFPCIDHATPATVAIGVQDRCCECCSVPADAVPMRPAAPLRLR